MTTPREYIQESIAQHLKEVEEISRCLSDAPDALLDMKAESIYIYSWDREVDGEKVLHHEMDISLGKLKNTPTYRSVSTNLLGISGQDQVETEPTPLRPGYFRQKFNIPGHVRVALNWADPKLVEVPCHEITVQGTRVIKWCGDKDSPPLKDGDVIIREDR